MRSWRLVALAPILVVGLLASASQGRAATPAYTITSIPTSPGGAQATAINDRGEVTGAVVERYGNVAFLYDSSSHSLLELGALPGDYQSWGYAINNAGDAVGESNGNGEDFHAFLYDPGRKQMVGIGALPGDNNSVADAINNRGQIAGYSWHYQPGQPVGFDRAFLYDSASGKMTDLGLLPGGTYSMALGINDQGVVVGVADGVGFTEHAFEYSRGVMTDLGTLPSGSRSEAFAINDKREVVGYSDDVRDAGRCQPVSDFAFEASPASHNALTNLGLIATQYGDCASQAYAINRQGDILGASGFTVCFEREICDFYPGDFFLDTRGTMYDLSQLIRGTGYFLNQVKDINDRGQIVGNGTTPDNQLAPLILTPQQ